MPDVDENFENPQDEDAASEKVSEDTKETAKGAADADESVESKDDSARKLQSERDKETARANKAEAELKKLKSSPAKGQEAPAEVQEWIVAARENMRRALFAENPRFQQYGIDTNLIVGDTPAEMRASAQSLTEFVNNLHGQVRNDVLKEHGFDPEPVAAQAEPRKNFNKMDSKEFDALVAEALRG